MISECVKRRCTAPSSSLLWWRVNSSTGSRNFGNALVLEDNVKSGTQRDLTEEHCCALPWNHSLFMKRYSWISSCVRVYGWKEILQGWRVMHGAGCMVCCDASLNVKKSWNSNSRLLNPNACSTLLFLLTPQSPFTSTVVALQWLFGVSTMISTRLLDGSRTFSCRLSRPWKTPVALTWMRTLHCSEAESLSRVFTALLTGIFGFLGDGGCWEPQEHTALSPPASQAEPQLPQSPHYSLSWNWAGIATELTSVSGTKQVQTQASLRIMTGIISYKSAAHFYFCIGWKRDEESGLSLQILFQDSNCCITHVLVFTCLPCVPTMLLNSLFFLQVLSMSQFFQTAETQTSRSPGPSSNLGLANSCNPRFSHMRRGKWGPS